MKNISLIDLKLRYENEKEELLPIIDNVLSSGNFGLSKTSWPKVSMNFFTFKKFVILFLPIFN